MGQRGRHLQHADQPVMEAVTVVARFPDSGQNVTQEKDRGCSTVFKDQYHTTMATNDSDRFLDEFSRSVDGCVRLLSTDSSSSQNVNYVFSK